MATLSFVGACRKFFGFKEGGYKGKQGLASFSEELKELTPADRKELAPQLAAALGEEVSEQ